MGVSVGDATHSRSGLNLALQWHHLVLHVHGKSHIGTVFSIGLFWKISSFI